MRIYIAGSHDTLFSVARKYRIEIERLKSLNPHISIIDKTIEGKHVLLPSERITGAKGDLTLPVCPPIPEEELLSDWIPVIPVERMAATEYDVLIVGSGAGGGAAAWRLCERWRGSEKRIGIVERGSAFLPTNVANIATMDGNNFRVYAPPQITDQIGKRLPQFPGAKLIYALGGRTLLWGAVAPRMAAHVLASWPVPVREMEMYYNIAEEIMNVSSAYTQDSSVTRILLQRLRENGFFNAAAIPIAADLAETRYGKIRSNVFFSSIVFLARALSLRPFDLAVNAYAAEVVTEGGKVAGVRVITPDKKIHLIRSKTVILSASTLQTPRILLNSGIPGKAIGRYLVNHSYLLASASVSTVGFPEPTGALGIIVPELEDRPFQLQIQGPGQFFNYQYAEKPDQSEWSIGFFGVSGHVEPRSENRVYIDPSRRDEYGIPEPQVSFSYSERDQAVIRRMYSALLQASSAMQLHSGAPNGAPDICLWQPGADNHDAGTCRMGLDPNISATNPFGQIHGVAGLYIADNSVLPSIGATNPTLSTVALSIRTADHIAKQI
ncbi:GMC oxidoreductase [Paenibacillus hamazuiensis]|uniref:GMC oxidoreductase n=1 Tax=Paenibacillus hamazuiensis TaxID=2936508 RepID=UPI003083F531